MTVVGRPARIPPELAAAPFRGSDAVAEGLLTVEQLRSKAWVRVMQNVYVPRTLELDPLTRVRALRLLDRPDHVVCGLTAAWIYDVWAPRPGQAVPLEVTRHVTAAGTPVEGYLRRRLVLDDAPDVDVSQLGRPGVASDVVTVDGLRVTSPLRTCFDLVRRHALVESVAFADSFAYAGLVSLPDLAAYCAGFPRWPVVRQARVVADLATDRSRSPGESRLRMAVVLAGLGEPLVNPGLYDDDGDHIATPDLLLLGRRPLALEYDGGYHDQGDQPLRDRRRRTRFVSSTDIPLVEFDREDLLRRRDVIVETVERKTGRRALNPLDPRDFRRGAVRWVD